MYVYIYISIYSMYIIYIFLLYVPEFESCLFVQLPAFNFFFRSFLATKKAVCTKFCECNREPNILHSDHDDHS